VAPFFVAVHLLVDDADLAAKLCERHAELHAPLPDLTSDMEVDRMRICADNHKRIIGQSRPLVQLRAISAAKKLSAHVELL
jgi:hypothetical protein